MIKEIIKQERFAVETRRLHITPIRKEEASHYLREFDLEITRYQYAEPFTSIESVKSFVEDFEKARQEGRHLISSLYNRRGEFVGSIEFYHLDTARPEVDIWICKNQWRQGYAYEALRGMVRCLSHYMKINEGFLYEADLRNYPGVELVKKLRGKKIGYHEVLTSNGEELQMTKYLITQDDNKEEIH